MTDEKVWFITGAGRGMGVAFAKAALAGGNAVVATGRDTDSAAEAVGQADDLLVVKLDVTREGDAEAAAQQALDRFGRIDVLVNNAGNFHAGYFEELTPAQIQRQLATTLIGPMNVTRAILPIMRKQRSGHIMSISSGAGLVGFEFCTAYAASKFGLEGWMESLQQEVEPFGIATTIVNPGFFRTELLSEASATYAEPSIADYAVRREEQLQWWQAQSGQQPGDPTKLARALIRIASENPPPRRFIAGADAIGLAEQKVAKLSSRSKPIENFRRPWRSRTHNVGVVMGKRTPLCSLVGVAGFLAVLIVAEPATTQNASHPQVDTVKIRIDVEGTVITATLEDNSTARDFNSLLPLTIMLKDYASTEKVADLPRRLNTEDAPAGIDPSVGDIAYYAPWGNLAIFYRNFGYASGLVKLGTIDSGIEALDRPGPIRATIELVEK